MLCNGRAGDRSKHVVGFVQDASFFFFFVVEGFSDGKFTLELRQVRLHAQPFFDVFQVLVAGGHVLVELGADVLLHLDGGLHESHLVGWAAERKTTTKR